MDALTTHDAVLTRCGHMFCRQCIEQHLACNRRNCPACRAAVFSAELVPVKAGLPDGLGGVAVMEALGDEDQETEACEERVRLAETVDMVREEVGRDAELVRLVQTAERESARVAGAYRVEVGRVEKEHVWRMEEVERREKDVAAGRREVARRSADVAGLRQELQEEIAEQKRGREILELERKRLAASTCEKERLAAELREEVDRVQRERERYMELRGRVREGGGMEAETRLLRKKVVRLERELVEQRVTQGRTEMSWETTSGSVGSMGGVGSVGGVVDVFSGPVQKASVRHNPRGVRRGGGLGVFAGRRAKVQKPRSGVAGRRI